jgi:hypothetical protein
VKRRTFLVFPILCAVGFGQESHDRAFEALSRKLSSESLKGRPFVQFAALCDPRLSDLGITNDTLAKDLELILRRNHIPIADEKSDSEKSGMFGITVDIVPSELVYSVSINATFSEMVTVVRTGERRYADVWSSPYGYLIGRMQLSKIRDYVRDAVEQFALDYLRANPQ